MTGRGNKTGVTRLESAVEKRIKVVDESERTREWREIRKRSQMGAGTGQTWSIKGKPISLARSRWPRVPTIQMWTVTVTLSPVRFYVIKSRNHYGEDQEHPSSSHTFLVSFNLVRGNTCHNALLFRLPHLGYFPKGFPQYHPFVYHRFFPIYNVPTLHFNTPLFISSIF
jgi:hypothetical protein